MKLLFTKENYNVLSPSSYTHISVKGLYISRIGLPILYSEVVLRICYLCNSLKVHKIEIFFGFNFEICIIS
jgi:hypothetical protein